MSKISGHGGYVVREGAPNVRVDNSEYEYDYESINDDVTTSGSGGVAQGLSCLLKLNSFTMSVPEDDAASPLLLGLTEGQTVSLWLRQGSRHNFDKITDTIVKSVRVTNPQDKARRVMLTCEYGSLARNTAIPSGFEA